MSPHLLERLNQHLGEPRWFWPTIQGILFLAFVLGSLEGGAP